MRDDHAADLLAMAATRDFIYLHKHEAIALLLFLIACYWGVLPTPTYDD